MPLSNSLNSNINSHQSTGSAGSRLLRRALLISALALILILIGTVILFQIKTQLIPEQARLKQPLAELTPTGQRIPKVIKSYVGKITSLEPMANRFTLAVKSDHNYLTQDKTFVVIAYYKTQIKSAAETISPTPASPISNTKQQALEITMTALNNLKVGETVVVTSRANIKDKEAFFVDRIVAGVSEDTTTLQGEYADVSLPYTTLSGQEIPIAVTTDKNAEIQKEIPKEVLGYVGEIISLSPSDKQFYILAEEHRNYLLEDTYFSISLKESTLINERTISGSRFNNINFNDLKLGDIVTVVSNTNVKGLESFSADRITRIVME